ncbi:alpha/beta fold hydrolase [Mycetocola zhujimingii]|uniref:alpha/beta fold hydrolase n=1 Tax=Mycetocola zhujimingii TaxID=2079792 RepID=UPI000D376124|nr:alpha/beta hydrolase [Mycetocola zhujimingii]AWB85426.1 alpha/beta hydrolase [Mycetocola zhujimingii]
MPERDLPTRLDESLPDVDWDRLAPDARRWTFSAPSGPLAALESGTPSAERAVLVPGVTGSKEDFRFVMPQLVAAGYFVQSFDLAGQYESWPAGPENLRPPRVEYDYDLLVGDLIAFLEAGSTPSHLLGYSFAGVVAQLVAAQRPDLVSSLTLLSTPPVSGRAYRSIKRIGWLDRFVDARGSALLMKLGIVWNVQRVPPGRLRFVRERFTLTRAEAHRQVMGLLSRTPDVTGALAAQPFPKLVAVGMHDLWPLGLHRRFAQKLGATIAVYRTGHSPCETAPHQLSRDLLELYATAPAERR